MDWLLKPKNTRLVVLIGFLGNAAMLVYELLKTPNPANPLAPLDKIIAQPALLVTTVSLGIGYVYLVLKKEQLERQYNHSQELASKPQS